MRRKRYMTQKRKLKRKRLALLSVLSISMIGLGAGILFLDNNSNLIGRLGASVSYYCENGWQLNGGKCLKKVKSALKVGDCSHIKGGLYDAKKDECYTRETLSSICNNSIGNYYWSESLNQCKDRNSSKTISVCKKSNIEGKYCKRYIYGKPKGYNYYCQSGQQLVGTNCYEEKNALKTDNVYNSTAKTECEKAGGTYKKNSAGKYQCVKTSTTKPTTNNTNNEIKNNSNNNSNNSTTTTNNNTTTKEKISYKIRDIKVGTIKAKTYTGKQIKPNITVKNNIGDKLKKDKDYEITYGENKYPGKGTIKITGKGKYKGSKSISFTIEDKNLQMIMHQH